MKDKDIRNIDSSQDSLPLHNENEKAQTTKFIAKFKLAPMTVINQTTINNYFIDFEHFFKHKDDDPISGVKDLESAQKYQS